MNPVTFTVKAWDGKQEVSRPIEALPVGALFVHKDACFGKTWSVSHNSGLAVGTKFTTRTAAATFAHLLGNLTDWSKPASEIGTADLGKRVRGILADHFSIVYGNYKLLRTATAAPEPPAPAPMPAPVAAGAEPDPLPTLAELIAQEPDKEAELRTLKGYSKQISEHLNVRVVKWPTDHAALAPLGIASPADSHLEIIVERDGAVLCTLTAADVAGENGQPGTVLYLDLDFGNAEGDKRWANAGVVLQNQYLTHDTTWTERLADDPDGCKLYREA